MKTLFCHVSKLKTLGEKPTVQGDDDDGRPPQGTPANVDIPLNFQIKNKVKRYSSAPSRFLNFFVNSTVEKSAVEILLCLWLVYLFDVYRQTHATVDLYLGSLSRDEKTHVN